MGASTPMPKGRPTTTHRKTRKQQLRRYHYDILKPFLSLFKPDVRPIVAEEIRPLLKDGKNVNLNTLQFLNFNIGPKTDQYSPMQLYRCLALMFQRIGQSKGTIYGKNMIFRYLSDSLHSNLKTREDILKSSINGSLKQFL
jgi:hypothetical protein